MTEFEVAKLEIEDGDILLVRVPADYSNERIKNIHRGIEAALDAANKRAIVLSGPNEVDFQIVRKSAAVREHE
jgi:bifunctional ADP-heptose synthase (sugar kinase/adenylyltransferase)